MYDPQYERLAEWATSDAFRSDVEAARQEFFARTGVVHEEDQSFEMRMSAFSEWYLFDRILDDDVDGRTPVERFLEELQESLTTPDRSIYRGLMRTRTGIYEVRKLRGQEVRIRDLVSGEDLMVTERRRLAGMEKGDLFQARLVPFNELLLFGRSFVYHPRDARRLIVKAVARRKKAGELESASGRQDLYFELAKTALHLERQQRNNRSPPPVKRIYEALLSA